MFLKGKYPLLWVAVCFAAGILLGSGFPRTAVFLMPAAGLTALAVLFAVSQRKIFIPLCLLFCLLLGAVRYQAQWVFPRNHLYHYAPDLPRDRLRIEGVVVSAPKHRRSLNGARTIFELKCQSVLVGQKRVFISGKVLVNIFREEPVKFGDRLRLRGRLLKPREFSRGGKGSYRDYLRRRGVYYILNVTKDKPLKFLPGKKGGVNGWFQSRRTQLQEILQEHLSPSEAAVMQAVLLGIRDDIPSRLKRVFRQSGTAHILAISGLHVGIVAAMLLVLLRMLPVALRWQYVLTILLIAGYVLLTGCRPSVVRAGVMTGIFLGGFLLERDSRGINSLAVAALVLLITNPNFLFDVGFQLSFASVAAILMLYPVLTAWVKPCRFYQIRPLRYAAQSVTVSLSAWLGAAALVAYYFEIVTPIAIFANLIVIPLITLIVAVGLGLLVCGLTVPLLAVPFAACLKLLLNALAVSAWLFSRVPGAYFQWQNIPLWGVQLSYVLFFFGGWCLSTKSSPDM